MTRIPIRNPETDPVLAPSHCAILFLDESRGGEESIPQLVEVLQGVPEIDRTQMNSRDREPVAAVKSTGRRELVFCARWTEVCLTLPIPDAGPRGRVLFTVEGK